MPTSRGLSPEESHTEELMNGADLAIGDCRDACCSPVESGAHITPERVSLISQALLLEWLTIAWMIVEGGVAIGAGVAAASLTCSFLGSTVSSSWPRPAHCFGDSISSCAKGERLPNTSSRIGRVLLFALAAYIVVGASPLLWMTK